MTASGLATAGLLGLLGLVMAGEGLVKLAGTDSQVDGFRAFGYPQWFRLVVGGLELLGAAGLLVGLVVTSSALVLSGSAVVSTVLVGALATHVRADDSVAEMAPAAVLLVTALVSVVGYGGFVP